LVVRVLALGLAVVIGWVVYSAGLEVRPTRAAAEAGSVCSRSDVEGVVGDFVAALNAGDQGRLASLFIDDPGFRWFSVSDQLTAGKTGTVFVAYSRPVLLQHFLRRHQRHERLVLRRLEIGASGRETGFSYELTRYADDLSEGRAVRYGGKGAVDCSTAPAIMVWSMGTGRAPSPLEPGAGPGTWGRLRRPLDLFRLEPGSDCPRSFARPANALSNDFGLAAALGEGPVYPILATGPEDRSRETARTGIVRYTGGRSEGGWYYLKVLWIEGPRYRGPALIRGRQLDGSRLIRFGSGPQASAELRLWDPSAGYPKGWLNRPTYMRLRGPGCYALQVDGKNFSRAIVLEAR
jgi:hypothetical protein